MRTAIPCQLRSKGLQVLILMLLVVFLAGCSSTMRVPEDDRLYIGLDEVDYLNYEKSSHATLTKEEVEAALSCKPNGALFGSSYHRTPFPYGLWIYNAFSESKGGFAKWITQTFGKAPVLLSSVNIPLRSSVAQSVLRSHGYMHGEVEGRVVDVKNPRKAKVSYTVKMNDLFLVDSMAYVNFPSMAQELLDSTEHERLLYRGVPFDVSTLDAERNRISQLLRDNGYYYYQPGFASYLADTLAVPSRVQLKLQMADSIPPEALRKWHLGKLDIRLSNRFMEQLNDSIERRRYTVHFNGKRPPIRMGTLMRDIKMRPGDLYSYSDYAETLSKLSSNGMFSIIDFKFTPRDSSATCDTLDMQLNCVFDRPYDFYVEANVTGKTTGFVGPGIVIGLTKRNAFRGGEQLDINLHGSYEWQTGHSYDDTSSDINSYSYGVDASLIYPRLKIPFVRRVRKRFYTTPSTTLKLSSDIVSRSRYFKRHIVSGEYTYQWQMRPTTMHRFSPLILQFNYLRSITNEFENVMLESPYLMMSMSDVFVPKMRYTFTYSSPATYLNPIYWETSLSESGNLLALGYAAFGRKLSEKSKEMFSNPFAQFLKLETDFVKTWRVGEYSELVGHLNAGVIWCYGNSYYAPYTEQFYVGGANSIRAFTVRTIGPGGFYSSNRKYSFMDQMGDIKFQANLEYRTRLFGNLYGALFLDAGNVWSLDYDDFRTDANLDMSRFFDQLAVGTGIGLRYDLDFFVLRLDWGIGLHLPYNTGKGGYFNIPTFHDGQSIHFAIGYPF